MSSLRRGDQFTPPANPKDKTFAVLTRPDERIGAYWCRMGRQWLRVWPAEDGALTVLRAINDWSQRDA